MENQKIWLVTGASKGLGLSLVQQLLKVGFPVAATSRTKAALEQIVGKKSAHFLPLEVDLTNENSVQTAIADTLAHFGSIDVVVNNAGYGQMGTLEELSDREVKQNFDVNVFGLLNVIRAVMPHLRGKRSGHLFNITSIGGYTADFAGWGIYCSTKFAVSGLTEALAAEAKSFNVKVSLVYPGYFRTNFLEAGSVMGPEHPIADYAAARESEAFHRQQMNGQQQGDPEKLANALIKMSQEDNPALHLFLGPDAYEAAKHKITSVNADLETWKSVSLSTSF